MKWFEGSIGEAVVTLKSRKAIFVVFVEGKDDTSSQVAQAINATEVSCRLEQEDFVAIRLESGSEAYRLFAQIYQLVPVPSIFFIGENGIPLEIIAGSITATDLMTKIEFVLTKAGKNKNSSLNLINAEQKVAAADNAIKSSNSNANVDIVSESTTKTNVDATLTQSPPEGENNNEVTSSVKVEPSTSTETPGTSKDNNESSKAPAKELTAQEKVERARQLIELQQRQRIKEEEKKEEEREMERRRVGREVQKLKQKQQDLEIKQAHEERMREKAADAAAREKVRQQIAQDKLERKQKELVLQQNVQKQQNQELPKSYKPVTSDATVTRIQFRLPSGNPHMGQFEPTNCLRDLRAYVLENIDLPFSQFAMSTSFPTRDLTHEDENKTLLELELVPTAVILILPLKASNVTATVTTSQDIGFLSRFIWTLFVPVLSVYNYVIGYFSGGTQDGRSNVQRQQGNSVGNRNTVNNNNSDGRVISGVQNVSNSSGLVRTYLGNQASTSIITEGNIRRLHSGGDDNDENNTWNGNSTQQM